ncbi:MAG: hypothetical protein ACRDSK_26675 [Actinophytocola sp.]|uniref:hypothetical protein n=1 Tax=Actinophytocola sp. TaxID=1872138 RepID=UPI003D6B5E6F
MDPLDRADAVLARARARGAFVVTPESAVSPMDAANTLQIPRVVVSSNDEQDPHSTVVVPRPSVTGEPPEERIPAIAQEALTDVVGAPPGIRSRQRRIEDARARAAARQQQPFGDPDLSHEPEPMPAVPKHSRHATSVEPRPEDVNDLFLATEQPPTDTGSLSQRLDG